MRFEKCKRILESWSTFVLSFLSLSVTLLTHFLAGNKQREAADQVDEIQKRLLIREADLTRIRSQREEFRGELTEGRARDAERSRASEVLKTLATSREDRIAAFSSQVRRLKMQLAARDGDAASVELFAAEDEPEIVKQLQGRLKYVFRLTRSRC
jgi:hypothetical protein